MDSRQAAVAATAVAGGIACAWYLRSIWKRSEHPWFPGRGDAKKRVLDELSQMQLLSGYDKMWMKQSSFALREVSPGRVIAEFTVNTGVQNFLRTLHGGATASALDAAAVLAVAAKGLYPGPTVEASVTYTAAAKAGTTVTVRSHVLSYDSSLGLVVCQSAIYDAAGRLVADGRVTKACSRWVLLTLLPKGLVKRLTRRLPTRRQKRISEERLQMLQHNGNIADLLTNLLEQTGEGKKIYFENFARIVAPTIPFAFVGFDQVFGLGMGLVLDTRRHSLEGKSRGGPQYLVNVTPFMIGCNGTLHEAAVAALVDDLGTAALVAAGGPPGSSTSLTVSCFHRAPLGGKLTVETCVLRSGRSMGFVNVLLRGRSNGVVYALGTLTKFSR